MVCVDFANTRMECFHVFVLAKFDFGNLPFSVIPGKKAN